MQEQLNVVFARDLRLGNEYLTSSIMQRHNYGATMTSKGNRGTT